MKCMLHVMFSLRNLLVISSNRSVQLHGFFPSGIAFIRPIMTILIIHIVVDRVIFLMIFFMLAGFNIFAVSFQGWILDPHRICGWKHENPTTSLAFAMRSPCGLTWSLYRSNMLSEQCSYKLSLTHCTRIQPTSPFHIKEPKCAERNKL